ncbi:hypothetical protein [Nocardia pseudovaccinii]|uniref:hypothetical protein n=1 Tax=Nocardia pseudovaccinii TaxID=189540 RepID=UPI0007A52208|nr:hypothetical protein [Nocardia pseudovaccinii]
MPLAADALSEVGDRAAASGDPLPAPACLDPNDIGKAALSDAGLGVAGGNPAAGVGRASEAVTGGVAGAGAESLVGFGALTTADCTAAAAGCATADFLKVVPAFSLLAGSETR